MIPIKDKYIVWQLKNIIRERFDEVKPPANEYACLHTHTHTPTHTRAMQILPYSTHREDI